jgi:hypothetical protein
MIQIPTPPGARETFRVRLQRQSDGAFVVTCDSPTCLSRAASEAEALEKIRAEIRYRLEWCPCTGVGEDYVQLDVQRLPDRQNGNGNGHRPPGLRR